MLLLALEVWDRMLLIPRMVELDEELPEKVQD